MFSTSGAGATVRVGPWPVHLPWMSLVGIGLVTYFWLDYFTVDPADPVHGYVLALVFAVLFYATILLHELAHATAARLSGYPVRGITLSWFGGFTAYERVSPSPLREGLIAVVGPLTSLLAGIAAGLVARATYWSAPEINVLAFALAWSNVFLAVYNALPGLPLDGGAVLRAIVWGVTGRERTGTLVAAWAGRVLAVLVALLPFWLAFQAGRQPDVSGLVFGLLIAALLWQGASAALAQLRLGDRLDRLSAAQLARRAVVVPATASVADALQVAADQSAAAILVLDAQGRPAALAQQAAVEAVPIERRPYVPVSSVSAALDPRAVVAGDLRGEDLVRALQAAPAAQYLVVGPGTAFAGVLLTSDVEAALNA